MSDVQQFASRFFRAGLVLLAIVGLAGCGLPNERDAERDFKAEYPDLQLIRCYAGEGNSDAVYFHFEYKDAVGKVKTMQVLYFRAPGEKVWRHGKSDGLPN